MRIYWFWPYVHPEQLAVPAAVPRVGDHLVLHTMRDRVPADAVRDLPFELRAELATPADVREHSPRWIASRVRTYGSRVAQRRSTLRAEEFDICHVVFANYFTDGIDFRGIARRTNLVFEVHDVVPHQSRTPRTIERMLLSLLYRAPGTIIVRHDIVRARLEEEFRISADRIAVIPWHVPEIGERSKPPSDRFTVLFFGTLRRNKGVAVLLRAITLLRDLADVRFVFAGRGFPDVERQIHRAAASDERIRFENAYIPMDRKHVLYSAADLVALPYTEFASSSAVLSDAYAYRVPVIATDVGALGPSVRSEGTGFVIPPGDAEALAVAIRTAVADCNARERARRSEAEVAASRTPERIGTALRGLYDRIAR
jgi:glycosyltransferase involved in cell wall biosynthesis